MALIKLGSTIAMIAGSIGGATYARNRYGAYIRNRTKPIDPGSNNQTAYRTRVSDAVAAWKALTSDQRDAFNAAARTTDLVNRIGESFNPSGINLFVRTYNLLNIAGITQVTVPPVTPIMSGYGSKISYWGTVGFTHISDTASWPADTKLLLWYAVDKTNSTYFFKGPYTTFRTAIAADYDGPGDQLLIVAEGGLAADTSMFAMWRLVGTDGAASHPHRSRAYKPPA